MVLSVFCGKFLVFGWGDNNMMRKILKLFFFAIFLEFFTKILNANRGKFVAKNPAEINSF